MSCGSCQVPFGLGKQKVGTSILGLPWDSVELSVQLTFPFLFFLFLVLGMECRASCMLNMCCTPPSFILTWFISSPFVSSGIFAKILPPWNMEGMDGGQSDEFKEWSFSGVLANLDE